VAPAPSAEVMRQLTLVWGLVPVPMVADARPGQDRLEAAVLAAFQHGAIQAGQLVVVLAGHPIEAGERFPTIRVVRVDGRGHSITP
jgi:pyruvate kinase